MEDENDKMLKKILEFVVNNKNEIKQDLTHDGNEYYTLPYTKRKTIKLDFYSSGALCAITLESEDNSIRINYEQFERKQLKEFKVVGKSLIQSTPNNSLLINTVKDFFGGDK